MPRFTVSLTEEQNTWVEKQAAALDRSKTYVIRELIDAYQDSESPFTAVVSHGDTGIVSGGDLAEQVTALTDRVATLEAVVTGDTEQTPPGTGDQATTPPVADGGATAPAGPDAPGDADTQTPLTDTPTGPIIDGNQSDGIQQPGDGDATGPKAEPGHGPRSASDPVDASTRARSDSSEQAHESVAVATVREAIREKPINEDLEGPLLTCWERLRRRGTANPEMFKAVFADHPAGFETVDAWWEAVSGVLGDLPGVDAPDGRARFYRYRYQHG